MRNLYKILALGLAVLMCAGILAVNVWAATDETKFPTPEERLKASEDFTHGPNDPNEDVDTAGNPINPNGDPTVSTDPNNPDNQKPDDKPNDEPENPGYYYDGDYFEDYFDEDDVEETKAEEKKDEEKTDEGGEYRERILKLIFRVGNKDMEKYINEDLTIIKMDAAPYIKDGRNMVGVRYVAEGLEMQVTWDAKTRTVFIEDDMFKIEIPVDTNKIIVNGKVMESDVMPEFVNGRTMLPIANIARALGLKDGEDIFWDNVEKKATIIRVLSAK